MRQYGPLSDYSITHTDLVVYDTIVFKIVRKFK